MSLIFFAENKIETAAITVIASSQDSTKPTNRLYDREQSIPWAAGSAVAVDIEADLGSAQSIDGFALAGHNFPNPTTIDLYYGAASPAATLWGSPVITTQDPYATLLGGTISARYWRLHLPALTGAIVPNIGEWLLGMTRTVSINPSLTLTHRVKSGNVVRDSSPARFTWAVKKGDAVLRSVYGWNAMTFDQLTALATAFADINQGAKKFVFLDDASNYRWASWLSTEYDEVPLGGGLYEVPEVIIEDAL